VGEQRVILENHAEVPAMRSEIRSVDTVDPDSAAVRLEQSGDRVQQGGLARAGRPEEGDEFAFQYGEGRFVQCHDGTVHLPYAVNA
jgi:hypothetical protein